MQQLSPTTSGGYDILTLPQKLEVSDNVHGIMGLLKIVYGNLVLIDFDAMMISTFLTVRPDFNRGWSVYPYT